MSNQDRTATKPPEYIHGEEVTITLTGKVFVYDERGLIIQRPDGGTFSVPVEDVEITRVTPAEGEPSGGELWRDRTGADWFVHGGGQLVNASNRSLPWQDVNEGYGPLALIYRPTPNTPDYIPGGEWGELPS